MNITFLCMILIGVVFDCTYYTMYDIYIVYLLTEGRNYASLGDVSAKSAQCPVPSRCSVNTGSTKKRKEKKNQSRTKEQMNEPAVSISPSGPGLTPSRSR